MGFALPHDFEGGQPDTLRQIARARQSAGFHPCDCHGVDESRAANAASRVVARSRVKVVPLTKVGQVQSVDISQALLAVEVNAWICIECESAWGSAAVFMSFLRIYSLE
jgi:hypothetical protein